MTQYSHKQTLNTQTSTNRSIKTAVKNNKFKMNNF